MKKTKRNVIIIITVVIVFLIFSILVSKCIINAIFDVKDENDEDIFVLSESMAIKSTIYSDSESNDIMFYKAGKGGYCRIQYLNFDIANTNKINLMIDVNCEEKLSKDSIEFESVSNNKDDFSESIEVLEEESEKGGTILLKGLGRRRIYCIKYYSAKEDIYYGAVFQITK